MEFNGSAGIWICLQKLIGVCACAVISLSCLYRLLKAIVFLPRLRAEVKARVILIVFC